MNLKIREAIANDYISISNLVKEVHNLHVKNRPDVYLKVDNPFQKEQFEDLLNSNNTKIFVVEDTNSKELMAYSIVQIMISRNIQILIPSQSAYIDDFCVKSSYQKKGIGKLLFEYILDYAKAKGASTVQLTVWEFNKNAIKFYESLGMSTRNRRMELNI
ncbi:MAG: GNAT family N-acetyltransferase [Bacillota bacterium]|nr:GNAT family N-acetyltransferase [Bacillota bacterium]